MYFVTTWVLGYGISGLNLGENLLAHETHAHGTLFKAMGCLSVCRSLNVAPWKYRLLYDKSKSLTLALISLFPYRFRPVSFRTRPWIHGG